LNFHQLKSQKSGGHTQIGSSKWEWIIYNCFPWNVSQELVANIF
jgi:hypothetical protein